MQLSPQIKATRLHRFYQVSWWTPDKVASLGAELRELAERKARQINEAFENLSQKRGAA